MFKIISCLLAAGFFLVFTGNQLRAQDSIEKLEHAIKHLQPFTSDFVQEYYDSFQDQMSVTRGRFSFMQPGLMKWEYQEPDEALFIVGAETAWLFDPVLENVTVQVLESVSGIESLRFLSGQEAISSHFKLTKPEENLINADPELRRIYLVPVEKNQPLAELQVSYDYKNSQIHQFAMVDHNRNYRRITLTNIKIDRQLKPSDFVFTVTENMEVIQGLDN